MRIVGRYVCQIELDINVDESKLDIPFDEFQQKLIGDELTEGIKDIFSSEFIDKDEGTVTVTKMYGDAYKVEEGEQE